MQVQQTINESTPLEGVLGSHFGTISYTNASGQNYDVLVMTKTDPEFKIEKLGGPGGKKVIKTDCPTIAGFIQIKTFIDKYLEANTYAKVKSIDQWDRYDKVYIESVQLADPLTIINKCDQVAGKYFNPAVINAAFKWSCPAFKYSEQMVVVNQPEQIIQADVYEEVKQEVKVEEEEEVKEEELKTEESSESSSESESDSESETEKTEKTDEQSDDSDDSEEEKKEVATIQMIKTSDKPEQKGIVDILDETEFIIKKDKFTDHPGIFLPSRCMACLKSNMQGFTVLVCDHRFCQKCITLYIQQQTNTKYKECDHRFCNKCFNNYMNSFELTCPICKYEWEEI